VEFFVAVGFFWLDLVDFCLFHGKISAFDDFLFWFRFGGFFLFHGKISAFDDLVMRHLRRYICSFIFNCKSIYKHTLNRIIAPKNKSSRIKKLLTI
jgi:hypothetical protein